MDLEMRTNSVSLVFFIMLKAGIRFVTIFDMHLFKSSGLRVTIFFRFHVAVLLEFYNDLISWPRSIFTFPLRSRLVWFHVSLYHTMKLYVCSNDIILLMAFLEDV